MMFKKIIIIIIIIIIGQDIGYRTAHEQGGCLVLSSCFNVLYFTKVNLILLVRVVGLLFMSYVTEQKLQSAEKLLSSMDFDTYYLSVLQ